MSSPGMNCSEELEFDSGLLTVFVKEVSHLLRDGVYKVDAILTLKTDFVRMNYAHTYF
jgi:hypothetical protein